MASLFIFANNAQSTLAAPITNSATSLTVSSGTGVEFPNPSAGQQFSATLNDAATGLLFEIVYCTAISVDTFTTIVRGEEGTSPLSWLAGDLVANVLTAGQMAAMVQTVTIAPNRIVTTSGAFTTTTADANGSIGLNRTSSPSNSTTTLPSGAVAGQTYTYDDLSNNSGPGGFPITINAPGGMSIAGRSQVVLSKNGGRASFTFYGSNIWGFALS